MPRRLRSRRFWLPHLWQSLFHTLPRSSVPPSPSSFVLHPRSDPALDRAGIQGPRSSIFNLQSDRTRPRAHLLEEFMHLFYRSWLAAAIVTVCVLLSVGAAKAQSGGGSSSAITWTVLEPSGAVVANATVEIHNAVSGFDRTTTTDINGRFSFPNVPFNPYHMTVTAPGLGPTAEDVEVRSALGVNGKVSLAVAGRSEWATVVARGRLGLGSPD